MHWMPLSQASPVFYLFVSWRFLSLSLSIHFNMVLTYFSYLSIRYPARSYGHGHGLPFPPSKQ